MKVYILVLRSIYPGVKIDDPEAFRIYGLYTEDEICYAFKTATKQLIKKYNLDDYRGKRVNPNDESDVTYWGYRPSLSEIIIFCGTASIITEARWYYYSSNKNSGVHATTLEVVRRDLKGKDLKRNE